MKNVSLFLVFVVGIALSGSAQDGEDQELFTEVFSTPTSIFEAHSTLRDRSFSVKNVSQSGRGVSMKAVLEDFGIEFTAGCSATHNPYGRSTIVRNTKEQLALVGALFEKIQIESTSKQILVFLEYIEVEAALYHDWMFENRMTGDGTALRKQAQKWIKSGKGTLIEAVGVTARSGQRAKTESISETIYPTEPGVPEIPNEVDLEGANSKAPIARGVSSAFETRNVGTTLEVDPVLGADNWTLDLNMAPEIVALTGYDHWPPENELPMFTISMPRFYTMKITTQITMIRGRYTFVGTARPHQPAVEGRKKPIVLTFVRAEISGVALPKTSDKIEPE